MEDKPCDDKFTAFTNIADSVEEKMIPKPVKPDDDRAQKRSRMYSRVDRFFLILFPLMFLLFNGVYWYTYATNVTKVQ